MAWAEILGADMAWAVVDADADTFTGPTDWDETGRLERRYDEPQKDWADITTTTTTWTER